ncbi:MAG: YwiC-like family protein [Actinomycetota bacterium]
MALPTEHGGWGFAQEPVLLGPAVDPSLVGSAVAAAAPAVFPGRRPPGLVAADLRRGQRLPRTAVAGWVLAACPG